MAPPRSLLSFLLPRIHVLLTSAPRPCLRPPVVNRRAFTTSGRCQYAVPMPPRPKVNETEIEEKFLHGSGPGGQKINKTSSAVQLKHLPTGIVVKSQATRSRTQNRKIARRILAERLELLEKGSSSRAAKLVEKKKKKKSSADKKKRRKYRKLQELKNGAAGVNETESEVDKELGDEEEEGKWVLADTEYNEAETEAEEEYDVEETDGLNDDKRRDENEGDVVREGEEGTNEASSTFNRSC